MDKKIIIGIAVVAIIVIIVVIVACMMKKEKFVSGQIGEAVIAGNIFDTVVRKTNSLLLPSACGQNSLVTDTNGNLSVTSSVPNGAIVMWTNPTIPVGWSPCDGTNGTPDLRSKFIVGANISVNQPNPLDPNLTSLNIGDAGGEEFHQLATHELPSHAHPAVTGFPDSNPGALSGYATNSGFNNSTPGFPSGGGSTGGDVPHNNLPPFYALVYIMKTV